MASGKAIFGIPKKWIFLGELKRIFGNQKNGFFVAPIKSFFFKNINFSWRLQKKRFSET